MKSIMKPTQLIVIFFFININMTLVGGSNLTGIAQYNERLVLQLIRRAQSLTKADIARITHLSAQTASVIINRLLAEKLLCKQKPRHEVGKSRATCHTD